MGQVIVLPPEEWHSEVRQEPPRRDKSPICITRKLGLSYYYDVIKEEIYILDVD